MQRLESRGSLKLIPLWCVVTGGQKVSTVPFDNFYRFAKFKGAGQKFLALAGREPLTFFESLYQGIPVEQDTV